MLEQIYPITPAGIRNILTQLDVASANFVKITMGERTSSVTPYPDGRYVRVESYEVISWKKENCGKILELDDKVLSRIKTIEVSWKTDKRYRGVEITQTRVTLFGYKSFPLDFTGFPGQPPYEVMFKPPYEVMFNPM